VQAGQFFMIKMLRTSVFLPRPISVAAFNMAQGKLYPSLSFLVNIRGQGSRELASMNVGEEAVLTGPLGNCFGDFLPKTEGKIALVSGGTGIAPLMFFANEPDVSGSKYQVDFYAGFKRDFPPLGELINKHLDKFIVSFEEGVPSGTPDGTDAPYSVHTGFVTDCLQQRLQAPLQAQAYQAVFCCGPLAMISKAAQMCKGKIPCFASFENRMACGVGACLGCTIKGRGNDGQTVNRRVCADGPIFNVEDIFYE
jgi:dihydroorotate dehydrogenase electron transfer subunit